ncbi:MAG: LacI family DNA-binding transcriptional regulator [Pseudomonadales bacterium]|nr:LacI family DNA-binding transcriptional regulator [Pseudomonadales bacterium]NRA17938.1 LacI family DNA-binding transcriptional regulator [Oceanospirillaceae bacterium]
MSKPTLQDVADYAAVSTATVSRCLNSPQQVKEKLRDKVNAAVTALGYTPHGAARALASRRSYTIGAVVPTIANGLFAHTIDYLQQGIAKQNFTLLLASSNYSLEEEYREVKSLVTRGLDGLVLIGNTHSPELYQLLDRQQIPFVNLWTWNQHAAHSCIGFNNNLAGRTIARHLFELGHRQVAIISGILDKNDRATERIQGARDYFSEQGYPLDHELLRECRYSAVESALALTELLAAEQPFSAVICGNDILALGALAATRELNIAVPAQLSITGFDNLEITASLSPGLTTINVPARRMGKIAAQYLLECIAGNSRELTRIELPVDLIVRQTTGPAKA